MRKNEITEENNMFFNYVCELKTTSNMAGTMVFGDLLQNCVNQRLFETRLKMSAFKCCIN